MAHQSRLAVRPQDHAQLLQHVAVVIDACLIDTDGHWNILGEKAIDRGKAALEAEIRGTVVADMGAGLGTKVNIRLAHPHAMAEGQASACQAKAVKMRKGRAASPAPGIFTLVGRFHEMDMHGHIMRLRQTPCGLKRLSESQCRLAGAN